jgi:hypothetical protein
MFIPADRQRGSFSVAAAFFTILLFSAGFTGQYDVNELQKEIGRWQEKLRNIESKLNDRNIILIPSWYDPSFDMEFAITRSELREALELMYLAHIKFDTNPDALVEKLLLSGDPDQFRVEQEEWIGKITDEFLLQSAQLRDKLERLAAGIRETIRYLEQRRAETIEKMAKETAKSVEVTKAEVPEKKKLFDKLDEHSKRVKWDPIWKRQVEAAIGGATTVRKLEIADKYLEDLMTCHDNFWKGMQGPFLKALIRERENARTQDEATRAQNAVGAEIDRIVQEFRTCAKNAHDVWENSMKILGPLSLQVSPDNGL